jgi:hypothetical protein
MPSYNLHGLESRTFQQLAQALAICEFGPGITVYGDGPDGGRDASYAGKLNYETLGNPWEGYTVIQAKFRQKPSGNPQVEGEWLRGQIDLEMAKFTGRPPKYKCPDFYLLITSVELTPVPDTGSDAKIRKHLSDYATSLPLKGWDVWDGVKLQRLLDKHGTVATKYGGFITAGDVLAAMQAHLEGLKPAFQTVMSDFLQSEVGGSDQYARLKEAGSAAERKTPLADVFVDLPTSIQSSLECPNEEVDELGRLPKGFVNQVIAAGGLKLDNESILSRCGTRGRDEDASPDTGRFVLIGGPGQGKSTLGQFICQLYRTAILKDRPPGEVGWEARSAMSAVIARCEKDALELPTARRFPVRIDLKSFAGDLAKERCTSLIDYIARHIDKRSGQTVDRDDLHRWLGAYPWLLVLDGLDEVPASSNRDDVLEQIQAFGAQCATRSADILIIATSRPQGYGEAFERHLYCHNYLLPLSTLRALHYARGLTDACYAHDVQLKTDIMDRLTTAAGRPTTSRLMRSPLQVTILTILAELRGELPHDRWQLFQEYYQTICNRETQRNLDLSGTLREYDLEIAHIHQQSGLRLQIGNEVTGENDALLTRDEFTSIVSYCLRDRFEGNDLERDQVACKIIDAALQRLVFLVSPQGQGIGFEIRSLQEFMAARALMEGSDKEVCDRLHATAPYPYWRNVFLFAAGKCVRERRHLVENIIGLCHTLNTGQDDPALMATLAGSRLALDLLEDATFRALPKHARALAEIALKVLDLPDIGLHRTLGEVCRAQQGLGVIVASDLERRLSSETPYPYAAWNVVLSIIDGGPAWATDLANRYWPADFSKQSQLARRASTLGSSRWLGSRLPPILNHAGPDYLRKLRRPLARVEEDLPTWVQAAFALIAGSTAKYFPVRLRGGQGASLHLTFISITQTSPSPWNDFLQLTDPEPGWLLFIAAARFMKAPSKETLAEELIFLSKQVNEEHLRSWFSRHLPWPFAVCVSEAKSATDLQNLAERVLSGAFGSTDEWSAQEERWTSAGLTSDDIEKAVATDRGTFEFPWTEFEGSIEEASPESVCVPDAAIAELARIYQTADVTPRKKWLADLLVSNLEAVNFSSPVPQRLSTYLSPSMLLEMFETTSQGHDLVDLVLTLQVPERLSEDWIELFDHIGTRDEMLFASPAFAHSGLVRSIDEAYLCYPNRTGLMAWLEAVAFFREPVTIPSECLHFSDGDNLQVQRQKLVLRLAQGEPVRADFSLMVSKAAELLGSPAGRPAWRVLRILGKFRGEDWVGRFTIELMAKLNSMGEESMVEECVQSVAEWLGFRKSPLHDANAVKDLGLEGLGTE